jgi:hypothetical protein
MRAEARWAWQRGAVLLVSLLVLLLIALIAATVTRTSQLQLRMAGNTENRTAAMQQALAAVDAVLDSPMSTPLNLGVGHIVCAEDAAPQPACDEYTLQLPLDALPDEGALVVRVARLEPAVGRVPVLAEDMASSAVYYRVAKFEVRATYDGTAAGRGSAAIAQGVLVRLPVSP